MGPTEDLNLLTTEKQLRNRWTNKKDCSAWECILTWVKSSVFHDLKRLPLRIAEGYFQNANAVVDNSSSFTQITFVGRSNCDRVQL